MKRKILYFFAFVALIPALLIIANFTFFSISGSGFLVEGTINMNSARILLTAMSLLISWALLIASDF